MSAKEKGFCKATMAKLRWLTVGVVLLLGLVGCSKPLLAHLQRAQELRWQTALLEDARRSAPVAVASASEAENFGRQLDTLTGFYETVISLLLGLLALVAGLAFWTIKIVTKAQAEETAISEATRILGNHDGFRESLRTIVRESVDRQMEEVRAKLDRLEDAYVPSDLAVANPNVRDPIAGETKE